MTTIGGVADELRRKLFAAEKTHEQHREELKDKEKVADERLAALEEANKKSWCSIP